MKKQLSCKNKSRVKWLIEYAELSGMRKQEAEAFKGFLTTKIDNIRKSYGRDTVDIQRQSVFVGTTNEAKYLRDETEIVVSGL